MATPNFSRARAQPVQIKTLQGTDTVQARAATPEFLSSKLQLKRILGWLEVQNKPLFQPVPGFSTYAPNQLAHGRQGEQLGT